MFVFDWMCAEGMCFIDYYFGLVVCVPICCVLIIGFYLGYCCWWDNMVMGGLEDFVDCFLVFFEKEDVIVVEVMKEVGYVIGGIGKWGLGNIGIDGVFDK